MYLDKYSAFTKDERLSVIACGDKAAALTCTETKTRILISWNVQELFMRETSKSQTRLHSCSHHLNSGKELFPVFVFYIQGRKSCNFLFFVHQFQNQNRNDFL